MVKLLRQHVLSVKYLPVDASNSNCNFNARCYAQLSKCYGIPSVRHPIVLAFLALNSVLNFHLEHQTQCVAVSLKWYEKNMRLWNSNRQ